MGYNTSAATGCANRAVGTMLAMTKPIDRMLQVLITNATVKETIGGWTPGGM